MATSTRSRQCLGIAFAKFETTFGCGDFGRIAYSSFFYGLGKAGTKEANKVLIFEEVEKRRGASVDEKPQTIDIEDDSFADSMPWTIVLPAPLPTINCAVVPLPDPWRAYIGTPHATRRSSGARSGLSPLLNQNR